MKPRFRFIRAYEVRPDMTMLVTVDGKLAACHVAGTRADFASEQITRSFRLYNSWGKEFFVMTVDAEALLPIRVTIRRDGKHALGWPWVRNLDDHLIDFKVDSLLEEPANPTPGLKRLMARKATRSLESAMVEAGKALANDPAVISWGDRANEAIAKREAAEEERKPVRGSFIKAMMERGGMLGLVRRK